VTAGENMSTVSFNTGFTGSQSIVNQGFSKVMANPSDQLSMPVIRLSRRGRLARAVVLLSLTVVMVAGFAAQSGANQEAASTAPSFTTIVVAPGETLWSVAAAFSQGDVQAMLAQIREANSLKGFDLQSGQKLRVPIQSKK
jgi:LysM repeat protein